MLIIRFRCLSDWEGIAHIHFFMWWIANFLDFLNFFCIKLKITMIWTDFQFKETELVDQLFIQVMNIGMIIGRGRKGFKNLEKIGCLAALLIAGKVQIYLFARLLFAYPNIRFSSLELHNWGHTVHCTEAQATLMSQLRISIFCRIGSP